MAKILFGTSFVSEDEPCIQLSEMLLPAPLGGYARFQIIYVLRGDKVSEFRDNLGSEKQWAGIGQLRIPGGVWDEEKQIYEVVETVGRIREIADKIRGKKMLDADDLLQFDHVRVR